MNDPRSTIDPLVWSRAGGDLLTAVYGYVPTLHDARLVGVTLEGDSATLRFAYTDLAEGAARSLSTRFELAFGGVRRLQMPLDDPWMLHASLSSHHEGLRLDLQTGGGEWISVGADRLEIRLLGVDAPEGDEPATLVWQP